MAHINACFSLNDPVIRPRSIGLKRFLTALLLVTVSASAFSGKLFLSGGGYDDKNTDLFVNGLRKATGKDAAFIPNITSIRNCNTDWAVTVCPRVAVVSSSKVDYATGLDAFTNDIVDVDGNLKRGYLNLFQTHGFTAQFITTHVDNYTQHSFSGNAAGDANIAILNQADVVWFTGGDQSKIARSWLLDTGNDSPLAATLRARWNNGNGNIVIAGDSAGNHIINNTMHGGGVSYGYVYFGANLQNKAITGWQQFGDTREGTTALRYFDNGVTMKGLGFMPAGLLSDTHFDARSGRLGRLAATLRHMSLTQGLGVDENTGVLVDTGASTAKVFGNGTLTVVDMAGASYNAGTTFLASGLRVSLLSQGDTYQYTSKTVTTAKASITRPYYASYYDSADIFSSFETSKSLTRLVDQTPLSNIGSAPAPVYSTNPKYPLTAPTVKVKFSKDSQTKGFFSNGKYTVVKALVQIY